MATCLVLANCASSNKFASRVDPKYGVSSSPRVVAFGEPVPKGGRLTADDVDFKRPGTGIGPDELDYAVGRTLARDLEADEELEWSDLA